MKRSLPILVAVAALAPNAILAQASVSIDQGRPAVDPPRVTIPLVRRGPTLEQLAAAMPPRARSAHKSGYATVTCRVTASGNAEDCLLEQEAPAGLGFGAAAMTMTSKFGMFPETIDGVPQNDGRITFVIVFSAEPGGQKVMP